MYGNRAINQLKQENPSINQLVFAITVGSVLGIFLLLGVGFSGSDVLHNAAHDSRHINNFPCH